MKLSYAADWTRVFRPSAGRRLGRRLLPPRPAVGASTTSTSSASTTTCRSPTGATAATTSTRPTGTRRGARPISAPTSPAARASTGTIRARATGTPRAGSRSPTAPTASPGCSATRTSSAWWGNAAFQPARRGRGGQARPTGCRRRSRSGSPRRGCPAVDKGANQPNVFPDPKSSASAFPYYSTGARDDLVQRRFCEAVLPIGTPSDPDYVDGANPLVAGLWRRAWCAHGRTHLWTWDARPFPAFPYLTDVWGDGDNWDTGHWLSGRLGGGAGRRPRRADPRRLRDRRRRGRRARRGRRRLPDRRHRLGAAGARAARLAADVRGVRIGRRAPDRAARPEDGGGLRRRRHRRRGRAGRWSASGGRRRPSCRQEIAIGFSDPLADFRPPRRARGGW